VQIGKSLGLVRMLTGLSGTPPARRSLCKVAASPGSAAVMSLKALISSLKFPLAAVI